MQVVKTNCRMQYYILWACCCANQSVKTHARMLFTVCLQYSSIIRQLLLLFPAGHPYMLPRIKCFIPRFAPFCLQHSLTKSLILLTDMHLVMMMFYCWQRHFCRQWHHYAEGKFFNLPLTPESVSLLHTSNPLDRAAPGPTRKSLRMTSLTIYQLRLHLELLHSLTKSLFPALLLLGWMLTRSFGPCSL